MATRLSTPRRARVRQDVFDPCYSFSHGSTDLHDLFGFFRFDGLQIESSDVSAVDPILKEQARLKVCSFQDYGAKRCHDRYGGKSWMLKRVKDVH